MKTHSALFVLLLLTGCEPVQDDSQAVILLVENPSITSRDGIYSLHLNKSKISSPYDVFETLPKPLMDGIGARVLMSDRIEIRSSQEDRITKEELVEQLSANQPRIDLLMEQSGKLLTEFPPLPILTDEDVQVGRHLDSIQIRFKGQCRLLLTDAIRCWSNEEYEECIQRYIASFNIGLFLLRDDTELNFIYGAKIISLTLREFDLRISEGLSTHLTIQQRDELGRMMTQIGDQWHVTQNMESLLGKAWKKLDENLNTLDHVETNLALNHLPPPLSTK